MNGAMLSNAPSILFQFKEKKKRIIMGILRYISSFSNSLFIVKGSRVLEC